MEDVAAAVVGFLKRSPFSKSFTRDDLVSAPPKTLRDLLYEVCADVDGALSQTQTPGDVAALLRVLGLGVGADLEAKLANGDRSTTLATLYWCLRGRVAHKKTAYDARLALSVRVLAEHSRKVDTADAATRAFAVLRPRGRRRDFYRPRRAVAAAMLRRRAGSWMVKGIAEHRGGAGSSGVAATPRNATWIFR